MAPSKLHRIQQNCFRYIFKLFSESNCVGHRIIHVSESIPWKGNLECFKIYLSSVCDPLTYRLSPAAGLGFGFDGREDELILYIGQTNYSDSDMINIKARDVGFVSFDI